MGVSFRNSLYSVIILSTPLPRQLTQYQGVGAQYKQTKYLQATMLVYRFLLLFSGRWLWSQEKFPDALIDYKQQTEVST